MASGNSLAQESYCAKKKERPSSKVRIYVAPGLLKHLKIHLLAYLVYRNPKVACKAVSLRGEVSKFVQVGTLS